MNGRNQKRTWLVLAAASTPVGRVAARTIRGRLEAVWTELAAAVHDPGDAERVHRLRVATRRTLAAFDVFSDLMPPKRSAWFERRLEEIRRAAGDARDLDVLTGRLSSPQNPRPKATARSRLVAMLARQRDDSRAPIHDLHRRLVAAGWCDRVDALLARIPAGSRQPSFEAYAREHFKPIVDRFFAKADRKLHDDDDVHRLRIAGKKFRYALEIFAPVIPQRSQVRCHEALARLQETLGEFTDHASAADRFRRMSRDRRIGLDADALEGLCRTESALAAEARKAFVKWWDGRRRRDLRRTIERSIGRRSA